MCPARAWPHATWRKHNQIRIHRKGNENLRESLIHRCVRIAQRSIELRFRALVRMVQRQPRGIQKPVPCDMACTQGNPYQIELFFAQKGCPNLGSALRGSQKSFPHSCEIRNGRAPVHFFHKRWSAESTLELTVESLRDGPPSKGHLVFKLPSTQSLSRQDSWRLPFIGVNHQRPLSAPCESLPHRFGNRIIVLRTHPLVCRRP